MTERRGEPVHCVSALLDVRRRLPEGARTGHRVGGAKMGGAL